MKRIVCLLFAIVLALAACALPHGTPVSTDAPTLPPQTETTPPVPPTVVPTAPAPTKPEPTDATEPTVATEPTLPEPLDTDLVRIQDYIPDIFVELPYATEDNFTGRIIYDFDTPWLRYGTVKKLASVQQQLREQGLSLKIWDGFRPTAAQFLLWEACPDPNYVSDPNTSFSSHSRGNTVDITLVRSDGTEIPMPTGFDDFTALADRDYRDCSEEAATNAMLLQTLMEECGFRGYRKEWWHFTDTQDYPVEETFRP